LWRFSCPGSAAKLTTGLRQAIEKTGHAFRVDLFLKINAYSTAEPSSPQHQRLLGKGLRKEWWAKSGFLTAHPIQKNTTS